MAAAVSGLLAINSPGLVFPQQPKKLALAFKNQMHDNRSRFNGHSAAFGPQCERAVPRVGIRCFPTRRLEVKCANSVGRDYQQSSFDDDSIQEESFWLSLIRETIWGLRSLFTFLVEQPSQLKYLEWPSFQSTLKTAALTLVLVALLIVALASVDSVLSFLLAFLQRRTP